ncbi:MAG TPA: phage holin family protein [Chthonomonadaceae bacterium]|nr:phage holin family protein [Chthonomonadaceae bacterium]
MKNWILRWIASAVALYVVANIVPGIHLAKNDLGALIVAVIALGLVNSLIRPIIMFFAWPINCLTFGLFGFALNVVLFLIVGQVVPGFKVDGIVPALIGMILMGIISGIINFLLKDRGDRDNR